MNAGTLGILAAYLFLGLMTLAVLASRRWPLSLRIAAGATTLALFLVTWMNYPALLGWPVERGVPDRFRLHSAQVQQPDKNNNSEGRIYLWVTDVETLGRQGTPRAYAIPYNAPTHEAVLTALSRLKKGIAQMGVFSGQIVTGLHDPTRVAQAVSPVTFYDVADPLFPDK